VNPKACHWYSRTHPGRIFEDLLILGSATNEEYNSGPGDIRAYDVRTGRPGVDLSYDSPRGRTRLRYLAERCLEVDWRRQRLEQHGSGCKARHRLRPDGKP